MKERQPRTGRARRWILLTVLVVLAAGVTAVGIWQKNNLEALRQFSQYTQGELETQLAENDQYVKDLLNEALNAAQQVDRDNASKPEMPPAQSGTADAPPVQISPAPSVPEPSPTVPDASAASDTASQTPSAPEPVQPTPTPAPDAPTVPSGPSYESQLQALVDRVYQLRQSYLQQLDALQAEAAVEYHAILDSQGGTKALMSFVSRYLSRGTSLERECDRKMDALVQELTALQKQYGQDLELVDAVKYTYAQEKSLKKAWYMSELESRGLI